MTEPASLEALGVFRTFLDERKLSYQVSAHSINTTLTFGFFGVHHTSVVAHTEALWVGVRITERIPPGFEQAVDQFGRTTHGRISLAHSGALEWGASVSPEHLESSDDVEAMLNMMAFEVSVVEGYLDRYAKVGRLPDEDIFFDGYAQNYDPGEA